MEVSEAQRLKAMEDENRRLKLLVAELSPARRGAEGSDPKKRLELAGLREEVAFVSVEFRLSERTACKLLGVERSSYRYEPRPDRNIALREELVKLARQKPRYGYRRTACAAGTARPRGEREAGLPAVCGGGAGGAAP